METHYATIWESIADEIPDEVALVHGLTRRTWAEYDERFGQAVTAVVALAPDADVDEATIIAGVKAQLAGFKAPRRVVFVAQIPRAPNGKADYKWAKQTAVAGITV